MYGSGFAAAQDKGEEWKANPDVAKTLQVDLKADGALRAAIQWVINWIHTKAILNTGMENRTVRNMIWGSRILPPFQVVSTICFLPNSWTFLKCKVSNHNLG